MKNKNQKNSEGTFDVSSEFSEDLPQKKFSWTTVNAIIAVFCFLNGLFLFIWLANALGITMPMILINVVLNIFLAVFYEKWQKIKDFQWQKGKRLRTAVILLRISAVISIVLTLSVPFVLSNSYLKYSKQMYQVKRYIYCHGVYSGYMDKFLPEKLPKVCDDYKFITQGGGSLAQDYHASSYLIFHTDTANMHILENDYRKIDGAELAEIDIEAKNEYVDENGNITEVPREFPPHVYHSLDDNHKGDFFNAVIYKVPDYYGKGCVFDYSSGLVVYWT